MVQIFVPWRRDSQTTDRVPETMVTVTHRATETFSDAEATLLRRHFTNLDRPVFALVNLPEAVKGAMFARYSRYPGTLRRLFLDEFADTLPQAGRWEAGEGRRAKELYERIFLGFGDDSVAQLGGAHIACEWCSNVLTKILERPRLAAYLEQSTRYIAYDSEMPAGGYRYYRDPELGPDYERAMDQLFSLYSQALPKVTAWAAERYPRSDEAPAAHERAVRAKALDLLRGLLPAAALSHVGVYASGQSYEQLIMHLLAHPLPEARLYGQMILDEASTVMPSFVARLHRPERGGAWIDQLRERASRARGVAERLDLLQAATPEGPAVHLLVAEGSELDVIVGLVYEQAHGPLAQIEERIAAMSTTEQAALLRELVGERENRRHRPGRGYELARYRFEIVSDYGAFRDLQRHRMLTIEWQGLTPELGAEVPDELVEAGVANDYARALETSAATWADLRDRGLDAQAAYAVCLGFRIRYLLDLNAREAMHAIELRSGAEGHPTYRAVAQEMHRLISEVHPAIGASMVHLDQTTEPRLERLLAEVRSASRR